MDIALFGNGLLGQALSRTFTKQNNRVMHYTRDQFDFTDLTRLQLVLDLWLSEHPRGIVINATAMSSVEDCANDPIGAATINSLVPSIMAQRVELFPNRRFVHFSTDHVFNGKIYTRLAAYHEDDHPLDSRHRANSTYGQSKAFGEQHVLLHERSIIIRTSWLFGSGRDNFITQIRNLALAGEPIAALTDYYACPSYTDDVANATRQLLESSPGRQIYHLVNGPGTSRFDLTQQVLAIEELDAEVRPVTRSTFADWKDQRERPPHTPLQNNFALKLPAWTDAYLRYKQARDRSFTYART